MLLLLTCLVLSRTDAGNAQATISGTGQKQLSLRPLIAPGLPVAVEKATVTERDGRGLYTLNYTVTNLAESPLTSLRVAFFVIDPAGHVKGGEGWQENIALTSKAAKKLSTVLSTPTNVGDRAVFVVAGAISGVGGWEVSSDEIAKGVKTFVNVGHNSLPVAAYAGAAVRAAGDWRTKAGAAPAVFTCATDFCKSKNAEAVKSCKNNGGVESFSCDPTACTFSFSCRGIILP
ncbi:MAG: hypothetical protein LC800_16730 [Acidobacteria bacterium]|nr:hypothetical protein [Acidobacteriota bacterium]